MYSKRSHLVSLMPNDTTKPPGFFQLFSAPVDHFILGIKTLHPTPPSICHALMSGPVSLPKAAAGAIAVWSYRDIKRGAPQ